MILYEVNLHIAADIFNDYQLWLIPHIQQMLSFKGFLNAQLCEDISQKYTDTASKQITVIYLLDNQTSLQNYLACYSEEMRSEGLRLFGNKFQATRKVLKIINHF